jgi:hypothetical protein
MIPLQQQYTTVQNKTQLSQQFANNVYELKIKKEIIQYLHGACFSPTKSAWIKAIKQGHFATWPGLTAEMVEKHLPKSIATAKGHLQQQRKNLRSTKKMTEAEKIEEDNIDTKAEPKEDATGEVYGKVVEYTTKIYTDLTGKFPHRSSRGSQYLFVMYDYDGNSIMVEPIKNRTEAELIQAYKKLFKFYAMRGMKPSMHVMDNEASKAFRDEVENNKCTYQLVPPHIH